MEIILREAIENLGRPGDVVSVRAGYARNFLLPRKLAYLATPGNIKVMEQEKSKLIRREAERRSEAEELRDMLNQLELIAERRVGEQDVLYGSVTSADIADAIEAKGFIIDKRKIVLGDNIKKLGEYAIPIRLYTEVVAEVTLHVRPEGATAAAEAKEAKEAKAAKAAAEAEAAGEDSGPAEDA
jgi:large subunit ribosomal protein L9